MPALHANEAHLSDERKLFSTLIDLLSSEKLYFTGNFDKLNALQIYHTASLSHRISLSLSLPLSSIISFDIPKDLQMKPYRTDEYVHKLFYETARFNAFNHQWVIKSRINNSQRDPHTVNDRRLTYQVSCDIINLAVAISWLTISVLFFFHLHSWYLNRRRQCRWRLIFSH